MWLQLRPLTVLKQDYTDFSKITTAGRMVYKVQARSDYKKMEAL